MGRCGCVCVCVCVLSVTSPFSSFPPNLARFLPVKEYGNEPDFSMKPGKVEESIPIIRKLNRHGDIVVRSSQTPSTATAGYERFSQSMLD